MRFHFSLILLVTILACANANVVRRFFDSLRNNGGNVESKEVAGLGTRFAEQLNKLTNGLMGDSSMAIGKLFDAIQSDLTQLPSRLKKLELTEQVEKQVNELIEEINQLLKTVSSALDNGLQKTASDLFKQLKNILPNIGRRIFALFKAGVKMHNLFPETWKEIKELSLIRGLIKDLNPARLLEFIKKLMSSFNLNGMLNGMVNGGFGFSGKLAGSGNLNGLKGGFSFGGFDLTGLGTSLSNSFSGLFNLGGGLGNLRGGISNLFGFGLGNVRTSASNDVRQEYSYGNNDD